MSNFTQTYTFDSYFEVQISNERETPKMYAEIIETK